MFCSYFSKRQANTIANGVLLILLGLLFYTQYWWPGILFALGISAAVRYYLSCQKSAFFLSLLLLAILAMLTFTSQTYSMLPLILIGIGIFLIMKEYLFRKTNQNVEIIDNPK